MAIIGYARTSTREQEARLQAQIRDLIAGGGHRGRRAEPNAGAGTPEVRPHHMTRNTGRAQCVHTADPCNKVDRRMTKRANDHSPGEYRGHRHLVRLRSRRYTRLGLSILTATL